MSNKFVNFLTLLLTFMKIISICSDQGNNGYATYHLYKSSDSLKTVACSDGKNGIITKWNISNLNTLFPYVVSWSRASWNSPNCGECILLTNKRDNKNIYLTVIDQCENIGNYDSHFDISKEAFTELFGLQGIHDGHGFVEWKTVPGRNCQGNKN